MKREMEVDLLKKQRLSRLLKILLNLNGLSEDDMLESIKLLEEQGANISYTEEIIRKVVSNGYFNVAWYLIEKGGKIYLDLILSAIDNFKTTFVKYLITKEPNFISKEDEILYRAIKRGNTEIVKSILDMCESKEVLKMSDLCVAIQNHQLKMFKMLLEYCKKYEKIDLKATYLLDIAIEEQQFDMVKELIELGIDITDDLLFLAISHQSYASFKYMFNKKDFSIDVVSKAIVKACERKSININIVKDLLEKPHYKWSVKDSIKIIRRIKKMTTWPLYINSMNKTIKLLKKDKNIVK